MRIRVMVKQVVADGVRNHTGHLGAARTVEIRDLCATLPPLERGKCGTDSLHVVYDSRGERMEMRHDIRVSRVQRFRQRDSPAQLYHAGAAHTWLRAKVDACARCRDLAAHAQEPGSVSEAIR